jgi:hypothetical protein
MIEPATAFTWGAAVSNPELRLVFDARDEVAEAARRCEADVFLARFGNTPEQLAVEYGPYEETSVWLAVVDGHGVAQAAGRLIRPGPPGLKTLNDLRRDPWRVDPVAAAHRAGVDPQVSWESATFAVRSGLRLRGYDAMEALFYGLAVGSLVNGFEAVVAVIDDRVLRVFGSIGLFLNPFPGTRPGPYLGSPRSSALYAFTDEILATQRRVAPDKWRAITTGEGITGITVPEPATMLLPPLEPAAEAEIA